MSGRLFVISGASGVGKSTVLGKVLERKPNVRFSVSATTRDPRPGEQHGVNYFFVTKEQFKGMIQRAEFTEYDDHMGNWYGTPTDQLEEKLALGDVILDIEPKGAFNVQKVRPATLIFIAPPSMEELERRLRGRGDTSEEQIRLRLERAAWEMEQSPKYDHIVINDLADACAEEIIRIIEK